MSKGAKSVFLFAMYLFGLGAALVLIPNRFLAIFRIAAVDDVWIRVAGMLVLILGYYYVEAARHELRAFIRATVVARSAVLVFFVAFVLLDLAPPILVVFGLVDAVAAGWTALAVRADSAS